MKKLIFTLFTLGTLSSCQNTTTVPTDTQKETFKKNYTAFLEHHVKGFETEDSSLIAAYLADSVKWSPPVWNGNIILSKDDMVNTAEQYFAEFDNLTFLPGDGGIDSKGAYWGGSYYSEVGESTSEPSGVRVYGTWTGTHTATGAITYNKWYAVIAFNEDGKVVMFSDWMDVSGMQAQIEKHVAAQVDK